MKTLCMHQLLGRLEPLIINLLYLKKIIDEVDVDDDEEERDSREWCGRVSERKLTNLTSSQDPDISDITTNLPHFAC